MQVDSGRENTNNSLNTSICTRKNRFSEWNEPTVNIRAARQACRIARENGSPLSMQARRRKVARKGKARRSPHGGSDDQPQAWQGAMRTREKLSRCTPAAPGCTQRATCRQRCETVAATRRRSRQAWSTGSKPTCFLLVLVLAARDHRGDGRHGAVGRTAGLGSRSVLLGFLGQLLVALFFGHKFSRYRLEIRLVEAMVSDKSARRNDTRRHPCVQSCLA